jgi:subtilase family serine protease
VPLGRPAWATQDRFAGEVDAQKPVTIQVHLHMRNETGAAAELAAISDPDSPSYGQFLSDDDFAQKYGPTDDDVAAVRAHLESNGLTVTEVPDNKAYIAATGTAAQIKAAFGARLGTYNVNGELRQAPIEMPTIKRSLAGQVLGVLGLAPMNMVNHRVQVGGFKRSSIVNPKGASPADTVAPNTCSEWFGAVPDTTDPPYGANWPALSYVPCGYKPGQIRNAYGFSDSVRKGNDGTGQTVAIVDAYLSPTLVADAQTYAANNDPDYPVKDGQITTYVGPGTVTTPDPSWYGEETLDVEAVHAMAPGAKIAVVGAASPTDQDLTAAINLIISKRLANIVSNSYGSPEGQANDFVIWHALATQAGLKGVGLYFASGDKGDEQANLGFPSADFPASLDNATAVGGTSLALDRTGAVAWETAWETGVSFLNPPAQPTDDAGNPIDAGGADAGPGTWDPPPGSWYFGAGGGTSNVYEQPKWQVGIVPAALANQPGTPARVVPDVGMLADPITGFVIGQTDPSSNTYGEAAIGGTSLACPLFAATMALAQQHAHKKFGFANALLYKASKSGAFRDITPLTSNEVAAIPGGVAVTFDDEVGLAINVAKGYDNITGLGAPNGATFLAKVK